MATMRGRGGGWAMATSLLLFAAECAAQMPSGFEEIAAVIHPDDRIVVTAMDGRSVKGRLVGLSDQALQMAVRSTVREFRAADIERVDRVHSDGLKNGVLWGLVVGLGSGFLGLGLLSNQIKLDDADASLVVGLFVLPAAGAAAGAAIDASVTRREPVYVRRRIAWTVTF